MELVVAVVLLAAFVMLPVWAVETAAIRRLGKPRRRLATWAAVGSVVAAVGLIAATVGRWVVLPTAPVLWAGLLTCNIGLVAWTYAARPESVARGFPVEPLQPPGGRGPPPS